mmetsp:Transcript_46848/g.144736  ORF Transcript_46848/g.144736 Transcript_46848/m.144736 type:complete len:226 (-) Transcript_46848:413-1090(-)
MLHAGLCHCCLGRRRRLPPLAPLRAGRPSAPSGGRLAGPQGGVGALGLQLRGRGADPAEVRAHAREDVGEGEAVAPVHVPHLDVPVRALVQQRATTVAAARVPLLWTGVRTSAKLRVREEVVASEQHLAAGRAAVWAGLPHGHRGLAQPVVVRVALLRCGAPAREHLVTGQSEVLCTARQHHGPHFVFGDALVQQPQPDVVLHCHHAEVLMAPPVDDAVREAGLL